MCLCLCVSVCVCVCDFYFIFRSPGLGCGQRIVEMCTAMIIRMLYILHFQQIASAADIADFDDEKYGFEYIYHDETVSMLMLLLRTRVGIVFKPFWTM